MYAEQRGRMLLFFLFLIVGLYLINLAFGFIKMPDFIISINKWIMAIAAIVIIFSGFKYLRSSYGYM